MRGGAVLSTALSPSLGLNTLIFATSRTYFRCQNGASNRSLTQVGCFVQFFAHRQILKGVPKL